MEINVTNFINNECPMDYCASVAEIGFNAAQSTWQAAKEAVGEYKAEWYRQCNGLRSELESHFSEYGAWDDLEKWKIDDLFALFVQDVSSAMRELEHYEIEDYESAKAAWESGDISGRLCPTEQGEWFFYLGM